MLHPTGEALLVKKKTCLALENTKISVSTFNGLVHVEWAPQASVTPMGQLPFFTNKFAVAKQASDAVLPKFIDKPLVIDAHNGVSASTICQQFSAPSSRAEAAQWFLLVLNKAKLENKDMVDINRTKQGGQDVFKAM